MSLLKDLFVFLLGALSLLYLLNPTAGIIELIPDNIPIVGNVDEATATMLFIGACRYFGYDPARFFTPEPRARPHVD